jgi:hypothetical protein
MPLAVIEGGEWVVASISTLAGAGLGFGLAQVAEWRRRIRERRERDLLLISMVQEEIATNLAVVTHLRDRVERELQSIDSGWYLDPLPEVRTGAWELLRTDLPRWLSAYRTVFSGYRAAGISGDQLNQLIRSRELCRTIGPPTERTRDIPEYDQAILDKVALLEPSLREIQGRLWELEEDLGLAEARHGRELPPGPRPD